MDFSVLKDLRKAKKITQEELANHVNISTARLSKIENNKGVKSIEILEDICSYLDCELRIIPKA